MTVMWIHKFFNLLDLFKKKHRKVQPRASIIRKGGFGRLQEVIPFHQQFPLLQSVRESAAFRVLTVTALGLKKGKLENLFSFFLCYLRDKVH